MLLRLYSVALMEMGLFGWLLKVAMPNLMYATVCWIKYGGGPIRKRKKMEEGSPRVVLAWPTGPSPVQRSPQLE
jgi:hypothetical protein